MNPSLAIIVLNWNLYETTKHCLESLLQIDYPNHKIVLVDNGSTDNSGIRLKKAFPQIVLISNTVNLGFSGGNNVGIQYAIDHGFEAIMLLNNDTIVTPNFVYPLINMLFSSSTVGAVQPKIMYNYDRTIIWNAGGVFHKAISKPITLGEKQKDNGQFDVPLHTEWITGCCFLVKSEAIKNVGLLDERFFVYYEDLDWSFKITSLGMELIYVPDSLIYHEAGMSDKNRKTYGEGNVSPFSRYHEMRNHLFIVRRYAEGLNLVTSWSFQVFKFLGYLSFYLIRGRFKKFCYVSKAFYHGITKEV